MPKKPKIPKSSKIAEKKLALPAKIEYKNPVNQQQRHANMIHEINKNENVRTSCESLGLTHYIVKRDRFIAAKGKAELRKYRQVIYTILEYDKSNPETWCTERMPVINKKLRKQEYVWNDQYHAKLQGLPIPE